MKLSFLRLIKLAIIIYLSYYSITSSAIEIKANKEITRISGKIEVGDYDKLIKFYQKNIDLFVLGELIYLDSPGGSVIEAMKIADFFKTTMRSTMIDDDASCMSSCFFLFVSGGVRMYGKNRLGIHRPYYRSEYFGKMSSSEARIKYEEIDLKVRDFLRSQRVPDEYISKMFSVPSESIYLIPWPEFEEKIGSHQPWFDELARSGCKEETMYRCMKFKNSLDRLNQIEKYFGTLYASKFTEWISLQREFIKEQISLNSTQGVVVDKQNSKSLRTINYACDVFIGGDRANATTMNFSIDTKNMKEGKNDVTIENNEYTWENALRNGEVVTIKIDKDNNNLVLRSPRLGTIATGICKPS